jgi:hypothetical protein
MTKPDQLDLEALDQFERSHMGQVWRERLTHMAARYAKTCQDQRENIDSIRASQGALEAVYSVLGLADVLRKEIQGRSEVTRGAR